MAAPQLSVWQDLAKQVHQLQCASTHTLSTISAWQKSSPSSVGYPRGNLLVCFKGGLTQCHHQVQESRSCSSRKGSLQHRRACWPSPPSLANHKIVEDEQKYDPLTATTAEKRPMGERWHFYVNCWTYNFLSLDSVWLLFLFPKIYRPFLYTCFHSLWKYFIGKARCPLIRGEEQQDYVWRQMYICLSIGKVYLYPFVPWKLSPPFFGWN